MAGAEKTAGPETLDAGAQQEPVFSEPWEARAFALTIALCNRGLFTYEDFRQRLIAVINGPEASASYYVNWLRALEMILADTGTLPPAEIGAELAALQATAAPVTSR